MIDRRHVVLGVALAASFATKRVSPPPLYYGSEDLYAGTFVLDAKRPTRDWIIVTEAVLPKEAADHVPSSISIVQAELPEGALAYPVALSLSQCADAGETEVLETQPSGIPVAHVWISDAFADCVPLEPCARRFCVELSNGDDETAAEVAWATSTGIESEDTGVNEDDASIAVSIDITIEEIEP